MLRLWYSIPYYPAKLHFFEQKPKNVNNNDENHDVLVTSQSSSL